MQHETYSGMDEKAAKLAQAWDTHLKPVRRELAFSDAKGLIHKIFDDVIVPRPFVKCMPAGSASNGFATLEHEIFLQKITFDDAAIASSAALLLEQATDAPADREEDQRRHFETYLCLAHRYTRLHPLNLTAYAAALTESFGFDISPRFHVGRTRSHWAALKPGDKLYDVAVGKGCRLFKRNGEPEPLRDVV